MLFCPFFCTVKYIFRYLNVGIRQGYMQPREKCITHIVAYWLKARKVEAKNQPLLGNSPYTRSRGTRHVRCDVRQ
jgi:hypothetical protein